MKHSVFALVAALAPVAAVQATTITFESPNDLANNFAPYIISGSAATVSQTAGLANNYAQEDYNSNIGSYALPVIYDPTPLDRTNIDSRFTASTTPFVVSCNLSVAVPNASIGFIISNPTSTGDSLLALINFDVNSSTSDRIRFFRDGADVATSAGTLAVDAGSTFNVGINASTDANPAFGTVTFSYWKDASGVPQLRIQAGSADATSSGYLAADAINTFEVGLRLFDNTTTTAGQTARFDNFTVVPEPASLGLLGTGLVALLGRRRSSAK